MAEGKALSVGYRCEFRGDALGVLQSATATGRQEGKKTALPASRTRAGSSRSVGGGRCRGVRGRRGCKRGRKTGRERVDEISAQERPQEHATMHANETIAQMV